MALGQCSDETFTFSLRTAISLGAAATEVENLRKAWRI